MKKILLAGAAFLALATSASAADLATRPYTKAPPVPVTPAYNWSGFYVGAMGGYGWTSGSHKDLEGGFGGGTIGFNWQVPGGLFLLGIEADGAGADISQDSGFGRAFVDEKIRSFGSVTGRVGLVESAALFYVKGGYAWADDRVSVDGLSDSKFRSGWTAGGGVEYMFAPNWSGKVEYMYADFDDTNYLGNFIPGGFNPGRDQIHTIKAGINYHFNWASWGNWSAPGFGRY